MTSKFILLSPLILLLAIGAVRLNRSPQHEMQKIKRQNIQEQNINLDECWPFPETLRTADPFVFELEMQLQHTNSDS